MFKRPTLFILGAGTGKDLKMPLGNDLSAQIATKTNITFRNLREQVTGDPNIMEALRIIAREKNENVNVYRAAGTRIKDGIHYTRSIDNFLHTHSHDEHLKICSKLAIAQCILEAEASSFLHIDTSHSPSHFRSPDHVYNSWLSQFMNILQDSVSARDTFHDVLSNLTIINFNYDRCIEHFLYHALQAVFGRQPHEVADLLNKKLTIYHPYGTVGELPWQSQRGVGVEFGAALYDRKLIAAAKRIRTYNEQIENEEVLTEMRDRVSAAHKIVFLGFHFHEQNMNLLTTEKVGKTGCLVLATAIGRPDPHIEEIDKRIREMLHHRSGTWNIQVEQGSDCKLLLERYTPRLMS